MSAIVSLDLPVPGEEVKCRLGSLASTAKSKHCMWQNVFYKGLKCG